jgi:RNA polymerase sigma-70 factor (ECF subfamily)
VQPTTADETFRAMFDEHFEALRAYCLRRLPVADANDAVAEVFVVALRKRDSVPEPDRVRPWLYGIARNVVRHSYRSSARRNRLQDKRGGLGPEVAPSPEVVVVRRGDDEELLTALGSLRDGDREILMLRVWEELSAPEIAGIVGISVSAAEKRISRAIDRLARAVDRTSLAMTDSPSDERGGG